MGGLGAGRGTEKRMGAKSTPVRLCTREELGLESFSGPKSHRSQQPAAQGPREPSASCSLARGLALAKGPKVPISQQSWPREFK